MKSDDKNRTILRDILLLYFVIFALWTGYRFFFSFPESFDEFVAKPLLWLLPLVFLRKDFIKNTVKTIKINISQNIIMGLFVGIIYFLLYTFLNSFRNGLPTFNPLHYSYKQIYLQLIIAISTGLIEEIVFRRYFLEESLAIFNDRIYANLFVTLLFSLIHLPVIIFVYKQSFAEAITYLSILSISGFIYGLVYLHKRSLTASTVTHAVWNFLGNVIR